MGPEVVDLRDHVREYTAQFRFIVRLYKQLDRDENEGVQGQFRTAVHTVEARIGGLGLDRLLAKLLMLRGMKRIFSCVKTSSMLNISTGVSWNSRNCWQTQRFRRASSRISTLS